MCKDRLQGLAENVGPECIAHRLAGHGVICQFRSAISPTHHLIEVPQCLTLPGKIGRLATGDKKLVNLQHLQIGDRQETGEGR